MTTQIADFARAVLLSADIDQKLANPGRLLDSQRGVGIEIPKAPSRPQHYPLRPTKPIPIAPTPRSIEDPTNRGMALHSFAHHELQALELMALILLRFPDAPAGFRSGLVRIMNDEQRHFSLYRKRAEVYGIGLGDVGASHMLWDTVSTLKTLPEWIVAVCLTFEQANLDFGLYWRDAFKAVDDVQSAKVFGLVHADEMGHVAHGVKWFENIVGPLTFSAYTDQLSMPLTAARGKGPVFNRHGRVVAGFSPRFIDEMEVVSHSKGRPPRIFDFDPFVEEAVGGRVVAQRVRCIAADLASLPMFLANRDDVVLAPKPSPDILRPLQKLGFPIPQFVPQMADLSGRKIGGRVRWGIGPSDPDWQADFTVLFDKCEANRLCGEFVGQASHPLLTQSRGQAVVDVNALRAALPSGDWVIKSPFSTAGQHRIRGRGSLTKRQVSWVERHIKNGRLLVQPWFTRILDLSTQVIVGDKGVEVVGHTRFWTDAGGVYRGSRIGSWATGIDSSVARILHGGGKGSDAATLLSQSAIFVGEWARSIGYRGPLGVDAMVVDDSGGLRLLPILEVNPRMTMGRLALEMTRQLSDTGRWCLVTDRHITRAGYEDRAAFIKRVTVTEGAYFTTDPHTAQQVLSLLVIGRRWQDADLSWQRLIGSPNN